MTNKTIETYSNKAQGFQNQYLSTSTEDVHNGWLKDHLPAAGLLLDVGAGGGRDAKFFAEKGLEVVAVEPAIQLAELGKILTKDMPVQWIKDTLPELKSVFNLNMRFDVVILSAVWMHIAPSDRARSFRKLSNLLKPSGKLIITLRHGSSPDEREMYSVSVDELYKLAQQNGLSVIKVSVDSDTLNRAEVYWETVVLQLPDDGTAAFPIVRNILINDSKSSTYKLALIRTLLRIADGHPGAVIERYDDKVVIPLGLVALYWARQYKPLLDNEVQQNSASSKGLAFVKEDGWLKLKSLTSADFSIGLLYTGEMAQAMHLALRHIVKAIEDGPVLHTKYANSNQTVFELEKTPRHRLKEDSLYLDFETLKSYGAFIVPVKIWDLMTQYAHWIEPVVLQEWVVLMQGFELNRAHPERQLYQLAPLLQWQTADRRTDFARKRVEKIRGEYAQEVYCVWDKKPLKREFVIDHCLPYSRCFNNDLWNLMPSTVGANSKKSDKIPTQMRYKSSYECIIKWWKTAWQDQVDVERFFTEASFSLPDLSRNNRNYEDVFESLKLQSMRVAEMQQLSRW